MSGAFDDCQTIHSAVRVCIFVRTCLNYRPYVFEISSVRVRDFVRTSSIFRPYVFAERGGM